MYKLSINSDKNKADIDAWYGDAHKWWRNFCETETIPLGIYSSIDLNYYVKEKYNMEYTIEPNWCLICQTEEDALTFVLKWS